MKIYLTLVLLAVSYISVAQQKISGTVTDSNNRPLLGVEVFINELQKGTSTDDNGYYELNKLPNNSIQITYSYLGFETQTKTVNLKNEDAVLNIVLEDAVFNMDEVIISTPFNKLQSENVMKVDKATVQQLKTKGAATLIEGVSFIPGVSQVSTGTGIGKPVIRGLRGNRVLVYTQGIRLENQQFGDEHGLGIDDSSVESVEVIKGPASLLYGSDALGGVIYFNPVKFADENTFNLYANQTYFSNTQGSGTSMGVKQSYHSWKFLANGAYNTHSDYETPDGDRVTNTRFNERIFNAAIGFNSKIVSSTARFSFNNSKVGIPEEIGEQSTSKTTMLPYQDLTNKMVSLNTLFFLNNSKISTIFGYTTNDRKEFEEHHHDEDEHDEDEDDHDDHDEHEEEALHPSLFLKLNTFSYDVKWHLPKKGRFEGILGVQGIYQDNSNYGEEILIPNAITNDFGALFTGTYDFKNNSSLQGGIRFDTRSIETEEHIIMHEDEVHTFDALDNNYENFSASLGYKTSLFKVITTRINTATGFKAPNLAELSSNGVHHGSNRFEIGNPDLTSERNVQFDVALEYDSKHFEIFANGFYNYINDYIFINPTGEFEDGYAVYEYTQENANLYGGEFGFHLHPHPLDWLHLQSSFETVVGKQDNGDYLPLIPANKFVNTIRTEFDVKKWLRKGFAAVTVESNLDQNNVSGFETATDGYTLLNIGAGATFIVSEVSFDVSLNLNNALNKTYVSHLSRLKIDGIPNIGRNFMASVRFSL